MAVTIHQEPQAYTPSGNPVVWTFSSTQSNQNNFSYLVEVYVNNQLQLREQRFPESGGVARYDGTATAERFCNLAVTPSQLDSDAANNVQMYIKVIERYGDPIASEDEATSGTIRVWKARLNDDRFIDWQTNSSDYVWGSGDTRFLTWWPRSEKYYVGEDEQVRLAMITDNGPDTIELALYDANNNAFATATQPISQEFVTIFNCGPAVLQTAFGLSSSDFGNAAYYTIQLTGGGSSEAFAFWIDRRCRSELSKRVHFYNTLGGFDSIGFNANSRERGTLKRYSIERDIGTFDGNNFVWNADKGRQTDYQVERETTLELNSNWLREAVQQWLVDQLYISPAVYLEEETLVRIKPEKQNYQVRTVLADRIFQETMIVKRSKFTSYAI